MKNRKNNIVEQPSKPTKVKVTWTWVHEPDPTYYDGDPDDLLAKANAEIRQIEHVSAMERNEGELDVMVVQD